MTKEKIFRIAGSFAPYVARIKFSTDGRLPFSTIFLKRIRHMESVINLFPDEDFFYLFFYTYFISENLESNLTLEDVNSMIPDVGMVFSYALYNDEVETECDECHGDGHEDCPNCERGKVECDECEGLGYVGDDVNCPTCYGEGEIDCEICDGVGRLDCDVCVGVGSINSYDKIEIQIYTNFFTEPGLDELYRNKEENDEEIEAPPKYENIFLDNIIVDEFDYKILNDNVGPYVKDVWTDRKNIGNLLKFELLQNRSFIITDLFN
jgi:hypothetical protein